MVAPGVFLVVGILLLLLVGDCTHQPRGSAATLPTTTRTMSVAACQEHLLQDHSDDGGSSMGRLRVVDIDGYTVNPGPHPRRERLDYL